MRECSSRMNTIPLSLIRATSLFLASIQWSKAFGIDEQGDLPHPLLFRLRALGPPERGVRPLAHPPALHAARQYLADPL